MQDENNALYERQSTLNLKVPEVISVVGCGGTGFWVALFAAMSGVNHIILFDPDPVEESNRNRLLLSEHDIGRFKTDVLADILSGIRPLCRVETHLSKIVTEEDCELLSGTVFCCTDTLKSQQLLQSYCDIKKMKYQRAGYDGIFLNVSDAFPMSFQDSPDGYRVIPSWVVPAAASAIGACFSQFYSKVQWMGSMADLGNKTLRAFNQSHIEKIEDELKDNGYGYCDNCDHDGYGYCDHCDRVNLEDGYGYCDSCDRVNLEDGYGYCDDCDRHSAEDYNDLEEKLVNVKDELQVANDDIADLQCKIEELEDTIKELEAKTE